MPDPGTSAVERWDQVHRALAAQKRRMVLYSLLDVPEERRLPLPEAAMAPECSIDPGDLCVLLQHKHLPVLDDAGFVRWEREPFCVQRGPYFEEVEAVFTLLHDSIDQLPRTLIDGCEVYEELSQRA